MKRLALVPLLVCLCCATPAPVLAAPYDAARLELARSRAISNPQSLEIQMRFAVNLLRSPYYEDASWAIQRLFELNPDFARLLNERYESAVAADPRDVEARLCLAFSSYFADDRESARRSLERAAILKPDDPWILIYLGYLQFDANKIEAARSTWKRVLRLDPDNAAAHFLMGQALFRQGQAAQGSLSLETAKKLGFFFLDSNSGLRGRL